MLLPLWQGFVPPQITSSKGTKGWSKAQQESSHFPHNGSDVLAALSNRNKEFPNVAAVRDQLRIVYVGEAKHWNELTKQAAARVRFFKANPSFTVRPSVVLKFLRLKKELDPAYSNVVINDAPEVIEALAKLPDELLNQAIVSESLRARELEAHVNARYTAVTEPGPLYLSQAHDAAAVSRSRCGAGVCRHFPQGPRQDASTSGARLGGHRQDDLRGLAVRWRVARPPR